MLQSLVQKKGIPDFKFTGKANGLLFNWKLYLVPPVVIFIALTFLKPGFITNDHIDKDNNITKKINVKALIITTLILSILVDAGIFIYFKKIKNKINE